MEQTRDYQQEIDRLKVQVAETGEQLAEAQRQAAAAGQDLAEAQAKEAALQQQLSVAERQRDEATAVAAAQADEAGKDLQNRVGGTCRSSCGCCCLRWC
jgi:hypothetical protein